MKEILTGTPEPEHPVENKRKPKLLVSGNPKKDENFTKIMKLLKGIEELAEECNGRDKNLSDR